VTEYAYHPLANIFPLLEGGEFAALIKDIRAHGLHEPIVIFEDQILDGRNRDRACRAAGVEPRYREMIFGSHAETVAYVISKNIHRRHLTAEQHRELIEKLLKADPAKSNLAIAKQVGRSDKTVDKVRRQMEANSEIPNKPNRTEAGGRKARGRKPKENATAPEPASPDQVSSQASPDLAASTPVSAPETSVGENAEPSAAPCGAVTEQSCEPSGKTPIDQNTDWRRAQHQRMSPRIVIGCRKAEIKRLEKRVAELEAQCAKWHAEVVGLKDERARNWGSEGRREAKIKNSGLESQIVELIEENAKLKARIAEFEARVATTEPTKH
jgi:ParB-like chromosome segregation protein Spo0J